jgi:hypothetical protein
MISIALISLKRNTLFCLEIAPLFTALSFCNGKVDILKSHFERKTVCVSASTKSNKLHSKQNKILAQANVQDLIFAAFTIIALTFIIYFKFSSSRTDRQLHFSCHPSSVRFQRLNMWHNGGETRVYPPTVTPPFCLDLLALNWFTRGLWFCSALLCVLAL